MFSKLFLYVLGLRYGFSMKAYRKFVNETKGWDKQQWNNYHEELIPKIIIHAYNHVPYYHKLFDDNGIDPVKIKTEKDLQLIPVTRKSDILANPRDFISDNVRYYDTISRHTGGTTGMPFPYLNDRKSWALNWAVKMQTFEDAGYNYGIDKLAVMAGGSLIAKKNTGYKHQIWRLINNYVSMPITHMTAEIMENYYSIIQKQKIKFLRGYPSAITTFAEYILSTNRSLPLTAVFTTAEMLYQYQRDIIRRAFCCETWDVYGCGDGMGQAADCHLHDKLHIKEHVSIMQIVDGNGNNVKCGDEGEIVLTSLYDYGMPFIRYSPGDYAQRGNDICDCGTYSKTLLKIIGRHSDVFKFSNGRILNAFSFPIEELVSIVGKYQIIQTSKDVVELIIEERLPISQNQIDNLEQLLKYHCGEGVDVYVKVVKKIEVPSSEKFRYIISKVS